MFKKLSSMIMISISSVMLTTPLFSVEDALENKRAPIGVRSESVEARMAQLEIRTTNAQNLEEETSDLSEKNRSKKSQKSLKALIAKSLYYTTHPSVYQNPVFISDFGDTVELTDGSVWIVAPADAYKTLHWLPTDSMIITPNHAWFSSYTFCLTNQNTYESVQVNLYLGPVAPTYGSYYTHWIVAIDYYYNMVYLEDGSVWHMSTFDSNVVNQWIAGDIVMIGVNDGWFSSSNPNMLINIATLNYAVGSVSF